MWHYEGAIPGTLDAYRSSFLVLHYCVIRNQSDTLYFLEYKTGTNFS
jgi:hypothetical protein